MQRVRTNALIFRKSLLGLQRLDFRAVHSDYRGHAVPILGSLFAKELPRLKELKYLRVTGGLVGMVKNLVSCEIGHWSKTPGPVTISQDELQVLSDNNNTFESLTINEFIPDGP